MSRRPINGLGFHDEDERELRAALAQVGLESTVRYLGIEVDDALEFPEQTEI